MAEVSQMSCRRLTERDREVTERRGAAERHKGELLGVCTVGLGLRLPQKRRAAN